MTQDPQSSFIKASSQRLPLVPLRDMVVFPHMMAPFIVGREASVRALEHSLQSSRKRIFLVAQKDPKIDEPGREDLHDIGVVAKVVQNLKLPNGNVKVMVEGVARGNVLELAEEEDGCQMVEVEVFDSEFPTDDKLEVYMTKVLGAFEQYAKMSHHLAFDGLVSAIKLDDADRFSDQLAAHLMVTTAEKQSLLELLNPYERLQRLHDLLEVEVEKINIDKRINVHVKKQMEKAQKEYYLNEKIKAIHQELGRKDEQDRRDRRAAGADREGRAAQGSGGEGRAGAQAARGDAAGVGRGDGVAQLHRLAGQRALEEEEPRDQGPPEGAEDPRRGPLRPREGQGAHPRVPGGAPADHRDAELDPLLRRAPRASARRRWRGRSPAPWAASSSACRWAACATRPRSAATGAPTSAPCPGRSSR